MQIHRSRHTSGFTVLPNAVLQDRRLSYTARGLLADLLSRPDGWREDGRRMADTSPQGRLAVAKALRELTAFGYYRVERVRRPDGTFVSQAHVYDTPRALHAPRTPHTPHTPHIAYASPHVAPGAVHPGSGRPTADGRGAHPVKDRAKEPSLPAQRTPADAVQRTGPKGRRDVPPQARAEPPNATTAQAAALLHQVTAAEPRLRLGAAEAMALAPLVAPWLDRGLGRRDLSHALLNGLPERVHSATAFLGDRLTRKLPPAPNPVTEPPRPRWRECAGCARPTPYEGICRACAGLDAIPPDAVDDRARTAARGRALVRTALNGRRAGRPAPARA